MDYRESGYINQAAPIPITRNNRKDHAAYLIRSGMLRRVRQPSAIETNSAKRTMAQKWLRMGVAACTQLLRRAAISYASNAAIRLTMPAAAINRVP
jgi:hypothetical protein